MAKKQYSESDIQVLSEIDHVHKRAPVYLGNTQKTTYVVPFFGPDSNTHDLDIREVSFIPAVNKLFSEIVDNASDELIQAGVKAPKIVITADIENSTFSVSDNGRGVPIGIKEGTDRHVPEIVFSSLRSGRNFEEGKTAGVVGMNGLGSSLVAICSEWFKIEIIRDGKKYTQTLSDATRKIEPPTIVPNKSRKTGTTITFKLKKDIFNSIILPLELVRNRAVEIAATNPGFSVEFNGEKFLFKQGFSDLIGKYRDNIYRFGDASLEFFMVLDAHNNPEEQMFTWVNSSLLFDGGMSNTQYINGFCDAATLHLSREAKKHGVTINRNDIRHGLMIFGNLKVSDPQYDSQAKTKMTGPNLRREFDDIITKEWKAFAKANKEWLDSVLQRAIARSNVAVTKQIIKDQKGSKKVKDLMEASSTNRSECMLLITEGLSAKSNIVQSRDPKRMASMPLTGKINNIYDSNISKLMKMSAVTDILSVIGLVPGKKAVRSELRYGKIVLSCDADVDGYHISLLLINLFYKFWPELLDPNYEPIIYLLAAPILVASKGKDRIHFFDKEDFENRKSTYAGHDITHMKGLGAMIKEDWDMILNSELSFRPIVDDGGLGNVLKLMFSKDVPARKQWLQGNENEI